MVKQDKAKEKEGLELLLSNTEDAYYSSTQKNKFYQNGNTEAREKAFLIAQNYYQNNPQAAVDTLIGQGYDELYEGNSQKVGLWDIVNSLAKQHMYSLSQCNVSEIVGKIVANSDYSKEKIEELAPSIKQHYDKQLGELIKDEKNEKAKKDYIAIIQLYNESLEAKKAKQLSQLKMENFLERYYKQEKQGQETPEE